MVYFVSIFKALFGKFRQMLSLVWLSVLFHSAFEEMVFFQHKVFDIFLISPQKHMLWVLIRSASQTCFCGALFGKFRHVESGMVSVLFHSTQMGWYFFFSPKMLLLFLCKKHMLWILILLTSSHNICSRGEIRKIFRVEEH